MHLRRMAFAIVLIVKRLFALVLVTIKVGGENILFTLVGSSSCLLFVFALFNSMTQTESHIFCWVHDWTLVVSTVFIASELIYRLRKKYAAKVKLRQTR